MTASANDASVQSGAGGITLGLLANWRQFALLVLINAFVGAMVGLERTVVPLVGREQFGLASTSVVLSFIVSFGIVKALTNLFAGNLADRIGRRRMLIMGAVLMAAAGVAFASTKNLLFLIIAGTIGVISPSGNEVGPFLSIEQASLSHIVPGNSRTEVFAWYTLAGSLATALGALAGGGPAEAEGCLLGSAPCHAWWRAAGRAGARARTTMSCKAVALTYKTIRMHKYGVPTVQTSREGVQLHCWTH